MAKIDRIKGLAQAIDHRDFVFKGKACDVTGHRRSDIALVTFDNLASIDERPESGPWTPWLAKRAELLGFSLIGLQSHAKDWYRSAEAPDHLETLKASGYFDQFSRVLFVGASMGGFAALCFAGLIPDARVLAFSPQSTLNRDIAPFERRYPWPFRKFDWTTPAYLDAAEYTPGIAGGHIFYDPFITADKRHAQRLLTPRLEPVTIPFADHTLIRTIAKAGALEHLIHQLATQGALDQRFWHLMRNRRRDPAWAKLFLQHVVQRGDGPLARRACHILHNDHEHLFARRTLKHFKQQARARKNARSRMQNTPFWTDALTESELRAQMRVFIAATTDGAAISRTVAWFANNGFGEISVLAPPEIAVNLADHMNVLTVTAGACASDMLAVAHARPDAKKGFIFTDSDIELPSDPAPDFMRLMVTVARQYELAKVGPALNLDPEVINLDHSADGKRSLEKSEKQNWKRQLEPGIYNADIDTSFFVHLPDPEHPVRASDVAALHVSWPAARIARTGFLALRPSWKRS